MTMVFMMPIMLKVLVVPKVPMTFVVMVPEIIVAPKQLCCLRPLQCTWCLVPMVFMVPVDHWWP